MAPEELNTASLPWRALLEEEGARLEGERVSGFAASSGLAGDGPAMVPLPDRAWLAFHGTDARQFLHDQLTAGVADVGDSECRLAAYCGPQGRALAIFRVTGDADGLRVELPAALADAIARRLSMFVLRADVSIRQTGDLTALGCWGEAAPGLLASFDMPVPDRPFLVVPHEQTTLVRLPGPVPRFQLTGPASSVTEIWRQWRAEAVPANTGDWQYLDVRAGLPEIGPETTDQFLPQSLGLEHWNAVNYRKGCYPGQEVIARAHYRGRLKRHLYRARIEGPPPRAGADVLDESDKRAGSIVSAAPDPGGGNVLLAVLHERAESGCRLADDARTPLTGLEPASS